MKKIIVGSRGSKLALFQTQWIIDALKALHSDLEFEIQVIQTKGDQVLDRALDKIGDKGLFVKEIEMALLEKHIDLAVHSMKDMPGEVTEGLAFAKTPLRQDVRDALILHPDLAHLTFETLPEGAVLGTGSKRRMFQLQAIRPDLKFVPVRGNIETRMNKIVSENLAGVVLAAAGLKRLGYDDRIHTLFETDKIMPAPAQGALAVQYRATDSDMEALLNALESLEDHLCITAERAYLNGIAGSCHIPIGAFATLQNGSLHLDGLLGNEDGTKLVRLKDDGPATVEGATALGKAMAKAMNEAFKPGMVYLVGAGPGDEGLMTLKGKAVLEKAEVVVYDRLVSDAILSWIPKTADRIYVGKASSDHAMQQEDINQLLVDLGKQGKNVVRLKGGDPYVFGRGGEEGELLKAENVPFEVIPGVTSAIGGLSYAGIPITHRDFTSSFHVFTGHFKDDDRDHDWEAIARLNATLVFLMGVQNLDKITSRLMAAGLSQDIPAALVSNATRANQKVVVGTVSNIVELAKTGGIKPPALLVIGKVVTCRETLNWFETRPLFGKSVVVTRARHQASKWTELLKQQGADVLECPAIDIEAIPDNGLSQALEGVKAFNWLVFMSENGVKYFMDGLFRSGKDVRALGSVKLAVVGTGTAKVLSEYGLKPDLIPKRFVSEGLIEAFDGMLNPSDKVMLVHAKNARDLLPDWLSQRAQVETVEVYQSVKSAPWDEDQKAFVENAEVISFTSASTVHQFMSQMEESKSELRDDVCLLSIGPITTEALRTYGVEPTVEAKAHNLQGMLEALLARC